MSDVLTDKGVMNTEGEYGKQIVQDLQLPELYSKPEVMAGYAKFGRRIHWIDGNVVPGSFQMNTSWYFKPTTFMLDNPNGGAVTKPHKHDVDEILGFYGSNPDDPYDLGGEIILYINGEKHTLTKSTLVFFPSGMEHLPLVVTRVDRPIFHFSIVMDDAYRYSDVKSGNIVEIK